MSVFILILIYYLLCVIKDIAYKPNYKILLSILLYDVVLIILLYYDLLKINEKTIWIFNELSLDHSFFSYEYWSLIGKDVYFYIAAYTNYNKYELVGINIISINIMQYLTLQHLKNNVNYNIAKLFVFFPWLYFIILELAPDSIVLSFFIYCIYKLSNKKSVTIKIYLHILPILFGIFLLRPHFIISLVPLFIFVTKKKLSIKSILIYTFVFSISIYILFAVNILGAGTFGFSGFYEYVNTYFSHDRILNDKNASVGFTGYLIQFNLYIRSLLASILFFITPLGISDTNNYLNLHNAFNILNIISLGLYATISFKYRNLTLILFLTTIVLGGIYHLNMDLRLKTISICLIPFIASNSPVQPKLFILLLSGYLSTQLLYLYVK